MADMSNISKYRLFHIFTHRKIKSYVKCQLQPAPQTPFITLWINTLTSSIIKNNLIELDSIMYRITTANNCIVQLQDEQLFDYEPIYLNISDAYKFIIELRYDYLIYFNHLYEFNHLIIHNNHLISEFNNLPKNNDIPVSFYNITLYYRVIQNMLHPNYIYKINEDSYKYQLFMVHCAPLSTDLPIFTTDNNTNKSYLQDVTVNIIFIIKLYMLLYNYLNRIDSDKTLILNLLKDLTSAPIFNIDLSYNIQQVVQVIIMVKIKKQPLWDSNLSMQQLNYLSTLNDRYNFILKYL